MGANFVCRSGCEIVKKTGQGAKDFRTYGLGGGGSLVRSSKVGGGRFAYVQHMCWLERFHEF